MPIRPKDLVQNRCKYEYCLKWFFSKHKRKYCSTECAENAQGGADRHMGRMAKDPTEEEIAEMCRKIRSGELVIQSSQERVGAPRVRIKPNWFLEKRIR